MATYRVRYAIYRVQASCEEQAKKDIVELMKKSADKLIAVEDASIFDERRPLWRRVLGIK